jgi:hypothetical protein
MVLMALGFLLSSCLTPSEHPILLEGASEVAPEPYLGEWVQTKHGGQIPDWIVSVDITQDATQMLVAETTLETLPSRNIYFFLTMINENLVLCFRHPASGFWNLMIASLEENNTRLSLRRLDEAVIKTDIESEVLVGSSRLVDARKQVVFIRATPTALRTYIENTPDAFEEEPYLVFEKVE